MKKNNIPKLRFPEFTDPWEQCKLKEISSRLDNLRKPITANKRVKGEIPYYGANGIQDFVRGYTHSGEFVLIAEDGASDIKDYPIYYVNGLIWVNNHAHVIQGIGDKALNPFLTFSLKRFNFEPFLVGGGRSKLNANILMELKIEVPQIEEQAKIGSFFEQLDNLITLHQRKLDKLKEKKKGLLQKMFPKNGELIPEVRFPEFTDDWEQCKLKFIVKERNIQFPENKEYPLMAFAAEKGVSPKGDKYNREFLVNDSHSKKYKRTEYGDFIYSSNNLETGSIGLNNFGNASISPVYSVFEIKKSNYQKFIEMSFKRKKFIHQMTRWRQGVVYGQWKIHEKDFLKMDTFLPKNKEQQKIGSFFEQLDNLITLHQRKLENLEKMKKSLLQQMFV